VTVAAFAILVRFWSSFEGLRPAKVLARTGMLLLVNALVLATALTQVNAQFLFFADWTDLTAAFHSTPTSTIVQRGTAASKAAARAAAGPAAEAGKSLPPLPTGRMSASGVISYTVRGRLSGIVGTVIVQLPAGYTAANNAGVRYPVLEAFQGDPESWIVGMQLEDAIRQQVDAHRMGPANRGLPPGRGPRRRGHRVRERHRRKSAVGDVVGLRRPLLGQPHFSGPNESGILGSDRAIRRRLVRCDGRDVAPRSVRGRHCDGRLLPSRVRALLPAVSVEQCAGQTLRPGCLE